MKHLAGVTVALGLIAFVSTTIPSCSLRFLKRKKTTPLAWTVVDTLPTHHGWLKMDSRPGGFAMLFDEKYKYLDREIPMTTPILFPMPPGVYDLRLKRTGYVDWRGIVEVAPEETTKVMVIFRALWTEESIRKQEKISLIIGSTLLALLMIVGWSFRDKF